MKAIYAVVLGLAAFSVSSSLADETRSTGGNRTGERESLIGRSTMEQSDLVGDSLPAKAGANPIRNLDAKKSPFSGSFSIDLFGSSRR